MSMTTPFSTQLQKIFHSAHTHAWNGPEVVRQAARSQSVISSSYREALTQFASSMMAVELTGWNQALRLASTLPSTEARLAATAQAADEANHFVTVQEYLKALGVDSVPIHHRLRRLLDDIELSEDSASAFLQLHLAVESVMTILFKRLAKTGVDIVLSKIMPYYLRDESRHVAFAEVYLPELIRGGSSDEIDYLSRLWSYSIDEISLWLCEQRTIFSTLGLEVDLILEEMFDGEQALIAVSPTLSEIVHRARAFRQI